eukprot:scaffold45142_cov45-Phaeocystis_antarctica.AAC.1
MGRGMGRGMGRRPPGRMWPGERSGGPKAIGGPASIMTSSPSPSPSPSSASAWASCSLPS